MIIPFKIRIFLDGTTSRMELESDSINSKLVSVLHKIEDSVYHVCTDLMATQGTGRFVAELCDRIPFKVIADQYRAQSLMIHRMTEIGCDSVHTGWLVVKEMQPSEYFKSLHKVESW